MHACIRDRLENGQLILITSLLDRIRILDSILDHIGGTPLVRINKISKSEGLECELGTYISRCLWYNICNV